MDIKRYGKYASMVALLLSQQALATTYRTVIMESELIVSNGGFDHEEVVLGGMFDTNFDFANNTLEILSLNETEIRRLLDFNTLAPSGVQTGIQNLINANDCDDDETPPCKLSVIFVDNYFNIDGNDGFYRGLFTRNKELFAFVRAEGENFIFPDTEGEVEFLAGVDSPSTLTVANLNGTYDLYAHSQGFFHDLDNGHSNEYAVNNNIVVTFNGDGTCVASEDIYEAFQPYDWPNGDSKGNNTAARDFDNFEGCSYSVDQPSGRVNLSVTLTDDEGEADGFSVSLAVSSQYRYLTGWLFLDGSVSGEFDAENSILLGVKRGSQFDNTSISGMYFFNALSSGFTGPNEANTVTRTITTYSGDPAGVDGFSSCTFGGPVAIGSAVHSATVNLFNDIEGIRDNFCRYKIESNGKIVTQTSDDGVSWQNTVFEESTVSDNGEAIIGITTEYFQNVAANSEVVLTQPSSASVGLLAGIKYNAASGSGPVTDFTRPFLSSATVSMEGGAKNNFDSDNDSDVLLRNLNNGFWRRFTMEDGFVESSSGPGLWTSLAWEQRAIGDFDGDADSDVLLRNPNNGFWRRFTIEDGFVASSASPGLWTSTLWEYRVAGDFDGDGDDDVLLRNPNNGFWRRFTMENGFAESSGSPGLWTSTLWEYQAVGDFDGDGDDDVLLRNPNNGFWRRFTMEDGIAVSSSGPGLWTSTSWEYQAVGDFDGDGDDDVLLRNPNTGFWRLFTMEDGVVVSSTSPGLWTSTVWEFRVVGDFDGDGDDDVLLRNPNNGFWRRFTMQNGAAVSSGSPGLWTSTSYLIQ